VSRQVRFGHLGAWFAVRQFGCRYEAFAVQKPSIAAFTISGLSLFVAIKISMTRLDSRWNPIFRIELVSLFTGVTDYEWFRLHAAKQGVEEVKFFSPEQECIALGAHYPWHCLF
jgi:hypothetical protein